MKPLSIDLLSWRSSIILLLIFVKQRIAQSAQCWAHRDHPVNTRGGGSEVSATEMAVEFGIQF